MTTLFSLIVVYLSQRYLKNYLFFKSLQQSCKTSWVNDLLFKFQLLANNFPRMPIMGASLLLVIFIGLMILILKLFFYYSSYHLGLLIFNLALLFYCLSSARTKEYSSVFVSSFENTLGMLFWFTLLGAVGLVLFWLFSLFGVKSNEHQANFSSDEHDPNLIENDQYIHSNIYPNNKVYIVQTVNNCLYIFHSIASWLPARIAGLVFSLIGDFRKGFSIWKEAMRNSNITHAEFVDLCGSAALGDLETDSPELLLERAFVAWIILCIMIGLII